jgi:predicted phosphate transport protein (TIGR00153 family)
MLIKKIFSQGKKEKRVLERITAHIRLLCTACEDMHIGLDSGNRDLIRKVIELEREGDTVRREIISAIYDGAFLPYLRPDLCRFTEMVDRVFDAIEDTANNFLELEIPAEVRDDCIRVAFLNIRICEMLLICFQSMVKGGDLRQKTLAIRIYEKKIDDLKFDIRKRIRAIPVADYWEGRLLADFVSGLTSISDIVEDASDYLHIINVSMR